MASRDNLLVNTGNILSLNELKIKAGQNPSEELVQALKISLNEPQGKNDTLNSISGNDNLCLTDVERKELKISAKIFIPLPNKKALGEALDQVLKSLDASCIESLVISHDTAGKSHEEVSSALQQLWPVVESYVEKGLLCSVGVSDVDTNVFIKFYEWAKDVKPNIVQINLASCCVVPPALQEFTKKNFIQLLTHSDPCQILPTEAIDDVFGEDAKLHWVARYQHLFVAASLFRENASPQHPHESLYKCGTPARLLFPHPLLRYPFASSPESHCLSTREKDGRASAELRSGGRNLRFRKYRWTNEISNVRLDFRP